MDLARASHLNLTPQSRLLYRTADCEATRALARRLAARLEPGDFLALVGGLGAGKTCFAQGLAEGLGVTGRVSSPTFVLMHCHPGPVPFCHVDAYRVDSGDELEQLGLDEYARAGVVALEWAERVPEVIPSEHFLIRLSFADRGRDVELIGHGARPVQVLEELAREDPGD